MVRVLRCSVSAYNDWTEDQVRARIDELERGDGGLADLEKLRKALTPDFGTQVHHRSNCWYVDAYLEGRWGSPGRRRSGEPARRFMLVPADEVPDYAEGCKFCESGALGSSAAEAQMVPKAEPDPKRVRVGSTVRVRPLPSGDERTWTIIGRSETRPDDHSLSAGSPVGKSLLGKRAGDPAEARTEKGVRRFEVLEVSN